VAHPGTMSLLLQRRKGFVRLALNQGVPLVPVISFGETDMYNMLEIAEGSVLHEAQSVYQRLFGFTVPLFWGKTIWGIVPSVMPKRTPIHIVVGPPLRAPKIKVRFLLLPLSLPFSLHFPSSSCSFAILMPIFMATIEN